VRVSLPLVDAALAAAAVGAAGAAHGAAASEARTASLLAVLVVLPVVFLGLVPREAVAAAYWVSELLPFAHAVRWFDAALYDATPWRALGEQTLWLLGIGAVLAALAVRAVRRLEA
jgi:ABC-2 type transport system permease protein